MIKCPLCKRVTEKGESTGKFTTFVKAEYKDRSIETGEVFFTTGTQIESEKVVCMNCNGSVLLK